MTCESMRLPADRNAAIRMVRKAVQLTDFSGLISVRNVQGHESRQSCLTTESVMAEDRFDGFSQANSHGLRGLPSGELASATLQLVSWGRALRETMACNSDVIALFRAAQRNACSHDFVRDVTALHPSVLPPGPLRLVRTTLQVAHNDGSTGPFGAFVVVSLQ